jgi:hypothetical protein
MRKKRHKLTLFDFLIKFLKEEVRRDGIHRGGWMDNWKDGWFYGQTVTLFYG